MSELNGFINISDYNTSLLDVIDKAELHVRVLKKGRKKITVLSGLEYFEDSTLKKLKRRISKHFGCSCALKNKVDDAGVAKKIFKISGELKYDLRDFLLEEGYVEEEDVEFVFHG